MPYSSLQLQAWQADSKFPYTFKLYGDLEGAGTDDGQSCGPLEGTIHIS